MNSKLTRYNNMGEKKMETRKHKKLAILIYLMTLFD